MPRASKMSDQEKVFYWADTGPVTCRVKGGQIVQAALVDSASEDTESSLPADWKAGE